MADNKEDSRLSLQERRELAQKREKQVQVISRVFYGTVLFLIIFSLQYFTGDPLGVLSMFGIEGVSYEKSGAYVDCSKRENRSHAYCKMKDADHVADKNWNNLRHTKKGSVFSLHGN